MSCFFLKKATRPKTSCEKQVVVQSKPNLALSVEVLSQVQHVPCCAKNTWRGEMYVLCRRGGVMHSMPHTAGLTRKPHYCKLPHFTLSKGAEKKKDSFDVWENFSHGSIKQSTRTYHTYYIPYMFYEMLLPSDGSLKLFFCKGLFCCGVLLSVNACMMLTPQRRAIGSRRGSSQHKRLSRTILLSLLRCWWSYFSSRPVLEIISYLLFFFFLLLSLFFFFAVVQTRHFFLMLKLLLVFCDGCSALSFLPPSVFRGWGENERERFGGGGGSSRAVVPNPGVWDKSEGSHDDYTDIWKKIIFLLHKIRLIF